VGDWFIIQVKTYASAARERNIMYM
jgi:hypothetical protein